MGGNRFDALARSFALSTRRQLLRRLLGATAGAALGAVRLAGTDAAARCRVPGEICRKNGDCCDGSCGPKDRTGRQYCACGTAADCPVPANRCLAATCVAGACGTTVGVTCSAPDECHAAGTCDPTTGVCSNPAMPNGTACDAGVCTTGDTCQTGVCTSSGVSACAPLSCCQNGACVATDHPSRCRAADGTCAAGGSAACPCCDSSSLDTCVDVCPGGTTCMGGDCQ